MFKKIFFSIILIVVLAILQVSLLSRLNFFGLKPNLALVGVLAILWGGNFWLGIVSAILAGFIYYNFGGIQFAFSILIFLATFLIIWFLGRRYIVNYRLAPLLILGFFGTIIFNFLYAAFGYLFFQYNFFAYFLSWHNLLEVLINGALTFLLGFIFRSLFRSNQ